MKVYQQFTCCSQRMNSRPNECKYKPVSMHARKACEFKDAYLHNIHPGITLKLTALGVTRIFHWHNPSGRTMALGLTQPLTEISKRKAIPLQALTGPEGSRRLRVPDFKTIGTWRWLDCQPYAPAAFTRRKYSWYSFMSEAESTPGP
jgi:hypothetical protein